MNSHDSKLAQHVEAGTLARLKPGAAKVFAVVSVAVDAGKSLSVKDVLRLAGVTEKTYFKAMRELESLGLIVRPRRGGT